MSVVLNYGGGRQTIAMCVLIAREVLPLPDMFIMADTGRENPATWIYLAQYVQPLLKSLGRRVEIIHCETPPSLTYGADDKPLIPVFTRNADGTEGKFSPFCTGHWKRDRMKTWLASHGVEKGERWIGFAHDEQRRIKRFFSADKHDGWIYRMPLNELLIGTHTCVEIVKRFGWDEPPISSCWMCPHKKNKEWRIIRDTQPELWQKACEMDEGMREQDRFRGGAGVWLHHSRMPLVEADLDAIEEAAFVEQCSLGACFI